MAKNAKRRHHIERLKKKRKGYWGSFFKDKENLEAKLNVVVRTPKPCSCWMCNKPRKRFGKPFNEIRQSQLLKDEHEKAYSLGCSYFCLGVSS